MSNNTNYSHNKVAEQIINYNNTVVELLTKLNQLTTTDEPTISVKVMDSVGNASIINMPSFNHLKSEIDRLNNNLNSIYNINGDSGALISMSNSSKFKRVISVDLNKEPNDIESLPIVNSFSISKNWFFDSLVNPQMLVDIDLSNKVANNIRKCLVRRYIINFEADSDGLTTNGIKAMDGFNTLFRGKSDITYETLQDWIKQTQGVLDRDDVNYDETIFDLEPNQLKYTGLYSVMKIEEDTVNKKLWYHLNTLEYYDNETSIVKNLAIGDKLIVNADYSTTKYEISEISLTGATPKVTLMRLEGNDVIPVGIETLKIYSEVVFNKVLKVSVGHDEFNIIFIKPLNTDNYILAKNWSSGVGFYTNDLRLSSNDMLNGTPLSSYYANKVNDYGLVLKDLVAKKIPNVLGSKPNSPTLVSTNFKVSQINSHLNSVGDTETLKNKNASKTSLKSEIEQLNNAINSKNKELKVTRFTSDSSRNTFMNELERLHNEKDSKTKMLTTIVNEIIELSNSTNSENAKFRIRGFWNIPSAIVSNNTLPQEVVKFKVEYRYLSKDGKQANIETYDLETKTAAYSSWVQLETPTRNRLFDANTNTYIWETIDESNADLVKINQIDIPIQSDEMVEIRIKSISEVGYPESPIESEWSNVIKVEFPEELKAQMVDNSTLLKEAYKEELQLSVQQDLNARGIFDHMSSQQIIDGKITKHNSDEIYSGFKDPNTGQPMNIYEYLILLTNEVKELRSIVNRVKGEIEVILYKNNEEFIVKNGSELTFTIECEDYLDNFKENSRSYINNIYVIKDFMFKIKNKSTGSSLGLLSNKRYTTSQIYKENLPQTFWVNNNNELLFNNQDGTTKTQLDNQFIWMLNYDDNISNNNEVTKLSDDIGAIITQNTSLTPILSNQTYNLGYNNTRVLTFSNNSNSLLDSAKWVDINPNAASTSKFLSTVHPVIGGLNQLVETNTDKIKYLSSDSNDDIDIPINIYFKLNALDNKKNTKSYNYVDFKSTTKGVTHIKKIRVMMETENDLKPFIFDVKFILNRSKTHNKKIGLNLKNQILNSDITEVQIKK